MKDINEIIKCEGQIKLTQTQFSKIISCYYQEKYKIKGIFDFLTINYIYIDEKFVYDYSLKDDMILSNKKIVNAYLPCIIDTNYYEYYKNRNIVIPGVIKLDELDNEIEKNLPFGVIRVKNQEIVNIFYELGLTRPLYNCFYDIKTNQFQYNVTTRKIELNSKVKVLEY